MPNKLASASPRDIIIAWATPVSVAQLGARLFAYAETKGAITTFHLLVRHTNLTACRKLPPELISMITSKVRDIAFERRMKEWVKISRCLANTCTTLSHVPRADLNSLAGMVSSNWAENDDWLAEQFAEEAAEAHAKDVTRYCRVLTSLKGRSKFAKCVQVWIHLSRHTPIISSDSFPGRSSLETLASTPTSWCTKSMTVTVMELR